MRWFCFDWRNFCLRSLSTFLLISLLWLTALPARAQFLTLGTAQEMAAKNNPDFLAAQKRLGVSEADIITAGMLPNPYLITDNGVAEKTYRMGLQQTFLLGGDRQKRVALVKAQRDVVLAELQKTLLDLRANIRQAYTQVYYLQERQNAYENLVTLSQHLLGTAQKRAKAGDIANVDVLQTELMALEAKNDLKSGSYDLVQARNRLITLLNKAEIEEMELTPPEEEPSLLMHQSLDASPDSQKPTLKVAIQKVEMNPEKLVDLARSRRPEIEQNLREQEVTRRQIALAKAQRIPDLTVAAGPDFVAEPGQKEINVFLVASLELPVWNRQQGPILAAKAKRVQLEHELEAIRNHIRLEVRNAYTAYQRNRQLIDQYREEMLPTAQTLVEKAQRAFQEGKTSILFPINAQQAYVKTRLGYLQSLRDYQQAITDLEQAIGGGL